VHVTVVVPRPNVLPEGGEHPAGSGPSTMSDAEAEKPTTAPLGPVASVVIDPGTVTVGGVVSWTVTVKLWEVSSSDTVSVAVHVTVVVAIGKVVPEGGEHSTVVGFPSGSVAVGSGHENDAPADDSASNTWSPGTPLSTGGSATAAGVTKRATSAQM
jgi:hypothetical protein